jgi:hypothetical protein
MRRWRAYDGLAILGGLCLVVGAGWIYPPAAVILAGVLLMGLGVLLDMVNSQPEPKSRRRER